MNILKLFLVCNQHEFLLENSLIYAYTLVFGNTIIV
jgi:hypothetical protein